MHSGYQVLKGSLRITITEDLILAEDTFLKNDRAPLKMPYIGIDYNKIKV